MIAGIGIDIIEVSRIRKVLEKNPAFRQRVFSETEITYCESKADPAMSYAVRFAAKEAFMKALGTGWNHEVSWIEIETVSPPSGPPVLRISGTTKAAMESRDILNCHLSLSHEKDYSVACVVLEKVVP
jgi:holo-[acyl-carrier protein] synthase